MAKKNKIASLILDCGGICAIVAVIMAAGSLADVRELCWIPIAAGILPLIIGIKRWLDN